MNPDAPIFYLSCNSTNQTSMLHLDPNNPCTFLSPTYFEKPPVSMSEIPEEPTAQDSSAPASTMHIIDPHLSAGPAVQYLGERDLQQLILEYGNVNPCVRTWTQRKPL